MSELPKLVVGGSTPVSPLWKGVCGETRNDGRVDGLNLDERSLTIFHDGAAIGALCATDPGWKANEKLTSWSYAKKAGPKVSLKRAKGDIGKITLTAVGGTFSVPLLPHVTVFRSDRCTTLAFGGPGKSCALKSKGKTLPAKRHHPGGAGAALGGWTPRKFGA